MARKATKRKSAKITAKTTAKRPAKKATRKTTSKAVKTVARKAVKKAKRKSAARRNAGKLGATYDTAISTLTHYIEQGGKNLSAAGKLTLVAAREVIHDVATKISKSTA